MHPVADVRIRRRQQTQREILQAAWHLAERDGIAGLSLRDLAGEVGMQAPSLYTYYDSKAAIYDAMFSTGYQSLQADIDGLTIDLDNAVGSVAAAIEAFVDFCHASVPRYQLLFTRAVPGWEPSPDSYAISVASYTRMAEQLAQLGIDDPRDLDLLSALTAGLASQQLANDTGGDRWRRLSHEAAQMFLSYVRSSR